MQLFFANYPLILQTASSLCQMLNAACCTLKEIEEHLQDFPSFLRVHHSYLVNLNEVNKYLRGEGGYLIMSDGSTVNVSRSRKETLLKHF